MRLKALLVLTMLWGASAAEARDLLSCEYKPSERVSSGRFGCKRKSPSTIYRLYKAADNYDAIHPVFKKWIEKNKKNYRYLRSGESLLYVNDEDGIGIYEKCGHIYLYRTRFFGDDQAWKYQKEPAINPETGRPWIELSDAEWREVKSGNAGMDEPDALFFSDVLAILNENFHYFYGMQLVDLGRDPNVDKAQLMGKFPPKKCFVFDKNVDWLDLSDYSEQQASLYRTLGHPVYSYEKILPDTPILGIGSDCGGKGLVGVSYAEDESRDFSFHNQVNPDDVNPSRYARTYQVYVAPYELSRVMDRLKKLCEERGVNLRTFSANKTPLTRALYFTYHKTEKYVGELVTHPYVTENCLDGRLNIEENVNHLYEVVPIEGLIGARSSRKNGKGTSSKSKDKTTKRGKTKKSSRKRK